MYMATSNLFMFNNFLSLSHSQVHLSSSVFSLFVAGAVAVA